MPARPNHAKKIVELWDSGERNKSRIAAMVGCSGPNVTLVLQRNSRGSMGPENIAPKVIHLWTTTELTQLQIAQKANCSTSYVCMLTKGVPRPGRFCRRPDLRKDLDPCGDPVHRLPCGEAVGVCHHHWETTKPLGRARL